MKIIVTGGSGFIGSRLVRKLVQEGHDVVSVDINEPTDIQGFKFVKLDLLDYQSTVSFIKDCEVVYHMAGVVLEYTRREPFKASEINIDITRNIVEACRLNAVKKIIFASSFYVYDGIDSNMIVNEATPLNPLEMELFGATKLFGECLIKEYSRRFGLDYVLLRFGSAYGCGKGSNVIQTFLQSGFKERKIEVWGKGKRRNQYTFVDDIATGNILAMDQSKEIFNLISPEEITTGELANILKEKYGFDIIYDTTRLEGMSMPYMSSRKAIHIMGWKPISLTEGISLTVEQMKT